MYHRLLPFDLEAERRLLAHLLRQPRDIPAAMGLLWPEDFFIRSHELTFGAMGKLSHEGRPVNPKAIAAAAKGADVSTLLARPVERIDVEETATLIREMGLLRAGVILERARDWDMVQYASGLDPCEFEPPF